MRIRTREETKPHSVGSMEEALLEPFIHDFANHPTFYRWSASTHKDEWSALIAEYDEGRRWYVVAWIDNVPEGFPQWNPQK